MSANYAHIPTTTCTVDTSQWQKIRVTGLLGLWVIHEWVRNNKDNLHGGYTIDGNRIFFQNDKDAVFCRLTIKRNADDQC